MAWKLIYLLSIKQTAWLVYRAEISDCFVSMALFLVRGEVAGYEGMGVRWS